MTKFGRVPRPLTRGTVTKLLVPFVGGIALLVARGHGPLLQRIVDACALRRGFGVANDERFQGQHARNEWRSDPPPDPATGVLSVAGEMRVPLDVPHADGRWPTHQWLLCWQGGQSGDRAGQPLSAMCSLSSQAGSGHFRSVRTVYMRCASRRDRAACRQRASAVRFLPSDGRPWPRRRRGRPAQRAVRGSGHGPSACIASYKP